MATTENKSVVPRAGGELFTDSGQESGKDS